MKQFDLAGYYFWRVLCGADYCAELADGYYYDPWNPWCGYIECDAEKATRHCCSGDTWMGLRHVMMVRRRSSLDQTRRLCSGMMRLKQLYQYRTCVKFVDIASLHVHVGVLLQLNGEALCRRRLNSRQQMTSCPVSSQLNIYMYM